MEWHKVTWYSTAFAVILFVGTFALAFYLGAEYGKLHEPEVSKPDAATITPSNAVLNDVTFACDGKKTARAIFHPHDVQLLLSDGRNLTVPQALSADGARYANANESFVFWNKGDGAFITEGTTTTFANCTVTPQPE